MDFIYFTWFHFFAVKLVASSNVQKRKALLKFATVVCISSASLIYQTHFFSCLIVKCADFRCKTSDCGAKPDFHFSKRIILLQLISFFFLVLFPLALYAKLKLLRFNLLSLGPKIQKRAIIDWFCSCARLASTKAWKRRNFQTEPATTPANRFFRTHATVSEKL